MIVLVMGVAGCGKSTICEKLTEKRGYEFIEGDSFHSEHNKEKMAKNQPLTDEDRKPWLQTIHNELKKKDKDSNVILLACSALKDSYRQLLSNGFKDFFVIFLKGTEKVLEERIEKRKGHFMPSSMLDSQFKTLEEPKKSEYIHDVLVVDIDNNNVAEVVELSDNWIQKKLSICMHSKQAIPQ